MSPYFLSVNKGWFLTVTLLRVTHRKRSRYSVTVFCAPKSLQTSRNRLEGIPKPSRRKPKYKKYTNPSNPSNLSALQTSQTFYWQLDALWTRVFHNCCDGCPIPMERSSQRVWNDRVQRVLIPRLSIAKNRQVDIAESTSRYCQIHLSILWIPNIVLSANKKNVSKHI